MKPRNIITNKIKDEKWDKQVKENIKKIKQRKKMLKQFLEDIKQKPNPHRVISDILEESNKISVMEYSKKLERNYNKMLKLDNDNDYLLDDYFYE